MTKRKSKKDLETTPRALSEGANDISSKVTDSVVRITSNAGICSGVLISSQIVLTAGHCVDHRRVTAAGSRRKVWEWMPLLSTVNVLFGNDMNNPKTTRTAILYNSVGFEDIIMLMLDSPISPNDVAPTRVLTRVPYGKNADDFFEDVGVILSGWGRLSDGNLPRIRQKAWARFREFPFASFGISGGNMIRVEGENGATLNGGDSGSPLFWVNVYGHRFVIGICQGRENNGGRFVATFGKGGVTNRNQKIPDVATWIEHILYSEVLPDHDKILPLYNWWNKASEDNKATSHPDMSPYPTQIVYGMTQLTIVNSTTEATEYHQDGYKVYRHEGYVFNPFIAKPKNTVPLFGWWNVDRNDYLITTKPSWTISESKIKWNGEVLDTNGIPEKQGYIIQRLEGYVFDPHLPQPPDTIPLISWWNGNRTDNHTTANPLWGKDYIEGIQWNDEEIIPTGVPNKEGYRMYRIEGYIYPNLIL